MIKKTTFRIIAIALLSLIFCSIVTGLFANVASKYATKEVRK